MSKFKPGPAKTRDGRHVVVYEVTKNMVFGRILGVNEPSAWLASGDCKGANHATEECGLLPNAEPFRFESEVIWEARNGFAVPYHVYNRDPLSSRLIGKTGILTFVESEEP